MSDKSKIMLTTLIVSAVTAIGYSIYAFGSKAPEIDDTKSWALAILIYIGISVVALIIVQILFRIGFSIGIAVKEKEQGKSDKDVEKIVSLSMKEDEMDKQINLKAIRINYTFGCLGSVIALTLLAFNIEVVYALHAIFISFFIGGIIEGLVSIYCYEKGL